MKQALLIAICTSLVFLGCLGGRYELPIPSDLDQINAYTCECSIATSAIPMIDPDGIEGIIVMAGVDDATEYEEAVTLNADDLVMQTGSSVGVRFREIPIPGLISYGVYRRSSVVVKSVLNII
ncbi:MAG: hypothetical protein ABFS43_00935 [Thermodesulfobacteriota bacterium]